MSESIYATLIMPVLKKDGKHSFCFDYQIQRLKVITYYQAKTLLKVVSNPAIT